MSDFCMLWETNQFDHYLELTGIYLLLSRSPKYIVHQTKLKVVFISLHTFMSQLEILCCSCVIASVRRGVLPRGYGDLYLGQDCIKLSHCDQPVLIVLSYMYINEWSVLFLFIWQLHHYYRNIKEIVIFRTSKQVLKNYNIDFPWE